MESNVPRWVIIVMVLLFLLTLGAMIAIPLTHETEPVPVWMLIANTLILSIPVGLLYVLLGVILVAGRKLWRGAAVGPRLAGGLYWCPRCGGILIVAFMSLFALDVFEPGQPLGQMLLAFLMHMLPMLALGAVLALAWHWPYIGAAIYGLAGLAFFGLIFLGGPQRIFTALIFGGPLLLIALLFGANGRWRREIEQARHPLQAG